MKKFSIVLGCLILMLPGLRLSAQNNEDEQLQLIRDQWGVDKKQLVMDYMKFTDAESKKFWPVYDAYMKENRSLIDARIKLIKSYAANYSKMTDAKAIVLINKVLDNNFTLLRFKKTY